MKAKVIKVTSEGIIFDNGMTLSSYHGQDCNRDAAGALRWRDCKHEWKEIDAPDLSENYGSVVCVKCGCPGEMTWATREVFWPAT